MQRVLAFCGLLAFSLATSCATAPEGGLPESLPAPGGDETAVGASTAADGAYVEPRVTLLTEPPTLGAAVREIGQKAGGSLVLMNGIEPYELGKSVRFRSSNYESVVNRLAGAGNVAMQQTAHYYFLYPEAYGVLTELSLAGRLHPRYAGIRASMQMPAGLELFNAFARLSEALDITVVADAILAEQRAGELTLGMVPVTSALEAILKSARVLRVGVDSTEEYVFFHSPRNVSPRSMLLNGDQISEQMRNFLAQKVNVALPEPGLERGVVPQYAGAKLLKDVLPELSRQLGVEVVAERDLLQIPINPVVMRDIAAGTALDLLIRQWEQPQRFGYYAAPGRITIARRPAGAL
jgi:hypothetical protein